MKPQRRVIERCSTESNDFLKIRDWRVGMTVECVEADNRWLILGQRYKLNDVIPLEHSPHVLIELNVFPGHLWGSFRFKPIGVDA